MLIQTHINSDALPSSYIRILKQRIPLIFSRIERHIESISISITDINGPRGGADQLCKVIVTGQGIQPVVISDKKSSAELAIQFALHRACNSVKRKLKRHQDARSKLSLSHVGRLPQPDLDQSSGAC